MLVSALAISAVAAGGKASKVKVVETPAPVKAAEPLPVAADVAPATPAPVVEPKPAPAAPVAKPAKTEPKVETPAPAVKPAAPVVVKEDPLKQVTDAAFLNEVEKEIQAAIQAELAKIDFEKMIKERVQERIKQIKFEAQVKKQIDLAIQAKLKAEN